MELSPLETLGVLDERLALLASMREVAADEPLKAEALDTQHREVDEERQQLRWRMSDADLIQYEIERANG